MALTLASSGQGGVFTVRAGSFGGRLQAGVTPAAPSLLLDIYPDAAAAYSLRKLRTAYTGSAIRVRRSSDNTETDIGFVSNQLDTATLLTFCGVGNGFVTTWYDQSGNANNASQVTINNQPTIINSGVLITENTKPSMDFSGDKLLPLTAIISSNTNLSMFAAQRTKTTTSWGVVLGHNSGGGSGPFFGILNTNKYSIQIAINGVSKNGASVLNAGTSFNILNTIVNSVDAYPYINDTLIPISLSTWTPSTTNFTQIGKYFNLSSDLTISELIVYKTDQTANRTAITNNINSYYSIY
jgi:hypothetical protein